MGLPEKYRVAVVQLGPVYLDKAASLLRALDCIKAAAEQGAQLVAFPETWFSGYPIWLDTYTGAALWDHEPAKLLFQKSRASALCIPGPETEALAQAAQEHHINIVLGANEAPETGPGNGSIFNSLLLFDHQGKLRIHHRKLMPTHGERLLHAPGDGHGLQSVEIDGLRIGGLICWEHWMPHARQAMHLQGEHLHIALWPQVKPDNLLACRHYALEGRCFVLAAGTTMRNSEFPKEAQVEAKPGEDPIVMEGESALIDPKGQVLSAVPSGDLLLWDVPDFNMVYRERMALDTSGHYNRPDVFQFEVDTDRKT